MDPGGFSTVYEKQPITAFLQERVDAAKNYITEVNERVHYTR